MKNSKVIINLAIVIFLFAVAVKVQIDFMKRNSSVTSTTDLTNPAEEKKTKSIDGDGFKDIMSTMPANGTDNINNGQQMTIGNKSIADIKFVKFK